MMWLDLTTNQLIRYIHDIRNARPTISFPSEIPDEMLRENGFVDVIEGPQPTLTANQYARYDGVVQDANGNWMTSYVAVDYTAEELEARVNQWRQSASCTPFQGKAALFQAGLLDDVEALIADAATDTLTKLAWANAIEWKRMSPMILSLATALELSPTQVDDLFKAAANINV